MSLHIKLLRELEKHGLSLDYNVSPFMVRNFQPPKKVDNLNESNNLVIAKGFLEELKKLGYITYSDLDISKIKSKNGITYDWFDKVQVDVRLLANGLAALQQHEYSKAAIRNYRWQTFIGGISLIIAFFTAGIAYYTYQNNIEENQATGELKKRLWSLQARINRLETQQTQKSAPTQVQAAPRPSGPPSSEDNVRTTSRKN